MLKECISSVGMINILLYFWFLSTEVNTYTIIALSAQIVVFFSIL